MFMNIDPSPVKLNYKLGDNVLKYWAEQGTQIRANFRIKADLYGRLKDD